MIALYCHYCHLSCVDGYETYLVVISLKINEFALKREKLPCPNATKNKLETHHTVTSALLVNEMREFKLMQSQSGRRLQKIYGPTIVNFPL